jgi:6-phosphogluconolactonase
VSENSERSLINPEILETEIKAFQSASTWLVNAINSTIAAKGSCVLVLAGGNSVNSVIRLSLRDDLNWSNVQFVLADERCVPVGHTDRNDVALSALFESASLQHRPVVHGISAELGPQLGAEKLSEQLAIIGQPDIALLSVADDGHIASLFPGSPALSTSEAAVAVIDCVKAPRERVSCSLKYLTSATYRIAIQTGHNKRDIFMRLQQGERLPLALFSPTHWFMDYNATR